MLAASASDSGSCFKILELSCSESTESTDRLRFNEVTEFDVLGTGSSGSELAVRGAGSIESMLEAPLALLLPLGVGLESDLEFCSSRSIWN